MSKNTLFKQIDRTFVAGSPGVPADPGRPYRPARWETRTRTECSYGVDTSWYIRNGWTQEAVRDSSGQPTGQLVWRPPSGSNYGGAQIPYTYSCRSVSYQVYVPAQSYIPPTPGVAPVPAQVITEFNIGWTARARSKDTFPNFGKVTFKVPHSTSGVVIGLNTSFQPTGYRDIKFAFYCSHGVARIIESGVQVLNLGAYVEGAVFRIDRYKGFITYYIDGVQVRQVANDPDPMFLDAALYTGGDSVDEPTISGISESETSLRPLTGYGSGVGFVRPEPTPDTDTPESLQPLFGEGWGSTPAGGVSTGELEALIVVSRAFAGVTGVLEPLESLGADKIYGTSAAELSPIISNGSASDELEPSYAVANTILGLLSTAATGLTGEIGGAESSLLPIGGLASEGTYGESQGSLSPLEATGSMLFENELTDLGMIDTVFSNTPLLLQGELVVIMNSDATVESVFAVQFMADKDMVSNVTVSSESLLTALASASMISTANGDSLLPGDVSQHTAWVANAETGGFTRYENFQFNSFAKIDGVYYGCREDGIYKLEGDDDNGEPVQAMLSLGKQMFKTTSFKKVHNCYLGIASDGVMYLKVIVEGEEYLYSSRRSDTNMMTQRIDLGRGLRATFYEFELYNADGEDFEINNIEFLVAPLTRRI